MSWFDLRAGNQVILLALLIFSPALAERASEAHLQQLARDARVPASELRALAAKGYSDQDLQRALSLSQSYSQPLRTVASLYRATRSWDDTVHTLDLARSYHRNPQEILSLRQPPETSGSHPALAWSWDDITAAFDRAKASGRTPEEILALRRTRSWDEVDRL